MNHSLKPWNTFGIDHNAQHIVCAEDEQQLLNAWQHATAEGQPVLILGEGSNVLFLEDYRGTVIINRIKGIEIHDEPDAWYLHVGAGENWHRLVKYTLQEGMPGLENLALIPGCVGSSPIQNKELWFSRSALLSTMMLKKCANLPSIRLFLHRVA